MQQLCEDYPDTFCRATCKAQQEKIMEQLLKHKCSVSDAKVEAKQPAEPLGAIQEEPRSEALIDGPLWVLNLHGDPLRQEDWTKRECWLSRTGRVSRQTVSRQTGSRKTGTHKAL